jgi:hypothetical protein
MFNHATAVRGHGEIPRGICFLIAPRTEYAFQNSTPELNARIRQTRPPHLRNNGRGQKNLLQEHMAASAGSGRSRKLRGGF